MSLFIFCFLYYLLAGMCISIGYHRCLTHRALSLRPWFEKIIITLGLPAGTPVQWVGNHRYHHAYADQLGDPHSPVLDGFWYAHNGWYIQTNNALICLPYALAGPLRTLFDAWHRPRTNQEYIHLADDIASDRYYHFISKRLPYGILVAGQTVTSFGFVFWVWGLSGIMALWITLIFIYNLGDFVDSVAHLYGTNPYEISHQAKNHWITGIFSAGEWHSNHHTFPQSARHGLLKGQFDLSWECIKFLTYIRIASNVQIPEDQMIQKKLKKTRR